ncbi:MAG: magnesium transporter [Bdellovibrionota bacterium]
MELATPKMQEAIASKNWVSLREMLGKFSPSEVASFLSSRSVADMAVVFRVLPRSLAAAVFEYLPLQTQQQLLKALAKDEVASILDEMAPDDRTLLLEELPGNVTKELLQLLSVEERAVAVKLLGYPENSVGRLMSPHYVAVHPDWTAQQVLEYVRLHGSDSETLTMVYVVNNQGKVVDDIRIRAFLLCDPQKKVFELMDERFTRLKATDPNETALIAFRKENLPALPVTDSDGVLIGIVTFDDVLSLSEERATQEIQKLGGSEALDEPYMKISLLRMVKKRASWLVVLFLGEMLTATAMGYFENEISKAVVLALFVPLIISSGGNSGSQAATLVIRALALNEVGIKDWWRIVKREILAGLALGLILGFIGFVRIAAWSAFSDIYGPHWLLVALTVSISLVGIVLWGSLAGSTLPLLLRRLGFDPATSSAPFVATLVDVTGLVIYFGVAMIVLHGTLL